MNYHNIKINNILELKLKWKISSLQPINDADLFSYLSYQAHDNLTALEILGYLFQTINAKYTLYKINSYIAYVLDIFYKQYTYSYLEKQYIFLFLLIRSLNGEFIKFSPQIYEMYNSLPKLVNQTSIIQWLENFIKPTIIMVRYFLNKPFGDNLNE